MKKKKNNTPLTNAEKSKRRRDKKAKSGLVRVEFWVPKELKEKIKKMITEIIK